MDILFVIGRVLFGGFFIINGINHFKHSENMAQYAASKGVPSPKFATYLTGLLILLGGLGILLGAFIKLSLILVIIFLLGVTFKMHAYWKITDANGRMMEKIQFQKNMALLGAALILLSLSEPWIWTI